MGKTQRANHTAVPPRGASRAPLRCARDSQDGEIENKAFPFQVHVGVGQVFKKWLLKYKAAPR